MNKGAESKWGWDAETPGRRWPWTSWVLTLALLLLGCHPRGTTMMRYEPDTGNEFRCHYVLDQKYAADQNPSEVDGWKAQVAADAAAAAPPHYDLFMHKGGGPAGAEWNSDGDLLIAGKLPFAHPDISHLQLTLNGKRWTEGIVVESMGNATWVTTTVPGPVWSAMLEPISRSDYGLLYSQEEIDGMCAQENGPCGIGKILRIGLRFQLPEASKQFLRAFAVAYGE